MTNRIPPSLNWLIDKRARLSGEIKRTKKALSKVQDLVIRLRELESSLMAVDESLKLHEIQVDVKNIKPITTQRYKTKFPHGAILDLILGYMRANSGHGPIPKSVVLEYINAKHLELDPEPLSYPQLRNLVQGGLNRLHSLGYISRCHNPNTNQLGSWLVNKSMELPKEH